MANEAILIQRLQDRLSECSVADGVAIPNLTILKLSDPNLGAASSADGDKFLGISATAKKADDGQTRMAIWTKGVFDLKTSGVVTVGSAVKISGANTIAVADDATAAGLTEIVGVALQAGTSGEVIEVRLGL